MALYLSGGLDSSRIGALATRSGDPLLALTHGFNPEEDETRSAHLAAESFGSSTTSEVVLDYKVGGECGFVKLTCTFESRKWC